VKTTGSQIEPEKSQIELKEAKSNASNVARKVADCSNWLDGSVATYRAVSSQRLGLSYSHQANSSQNNNISD
jgi:hypothetical protein